MAEDTPTAVYILGGVVGIIALSLGFVEGKVPLKFHDVCREESPFWFWLLMALYGSATIACLYGLTFA